VDVQALVIDTLDPRALYAATATTVYKSTDGANSWAAIDSPGAPVQLILDSRNRIIYEVSSGIRKSADGGLSWTPVSFPGAVSTVAIDPNASGHLFAISTPMFCGPTCPNNQAAISYRTIDGGATWIAAPVAPSSPPRLIVDASTNPSTIYDGLVAKSVDGGQTWSPIANPFRNSVINTMAVDSAGNVYVDIAGSGLFVSHDRAQTWTAVGYPGGPGITGANGIGLKSIAPASPNTLYVTANQQAAAGFVSKLSADGSTLEFSTYLRGHASLESFPQVAGEPAGMLLQNEISGVALDGAGDIVVAGVTRAADFPTVNAAQAINAGMADAFAAVIPADGGKLGYATYFGGSQDDGALAMAVDSQGNIIIAGQTWSGDRGAGAAAPGFGDAFAAKLSTAAPIVQRHRRR
jgi:hypothetical protein